MLMTKRLEDMKDGRFVYSIIEWNARRPIFVPERFARIIAMHLVANHHVDTRDSTPLVLCVAGPFGTGKSVILRDALYRLGVNVVYIGASELESPNSGEPAARVRRAYAQAAAEQARTNTPAAFVIDDVDLAVGLAGPHTADTTNRAHVISAIMELADRPNCVEGQPCDRVPLFFTANNLKAVYGAMTRPGRMTVYKWNPAGEELAAIALHIMHGLISEEQISRLMKNNSSWTAAHFGALKSRVQIRLIERMYTNSPAREVLRDLLDTVPVKHPRLSDDALCDCELDMIAREVNEEVQSRCDFTAPRTEECND